MTDFDNPEDQTQMPGVGDQHLGPSVEDRDFVERVLNERAAVLARHIEVEVVEETTDLVTLDVGGHSYAIEAKLVREVFPVREVTPLPTSPDFVLGITNVRGKIIAVLDLLRVLGMGAATRSARQIVIVAIGAIEVAFDIGESGIARIPRSRVRPASLPAGSYVKAVTSDDLGILDVERIIGDTRQTAASLATGADE